jgi:hypothetical protein
MKASYILFIVAILGFTTWACNSSSAEQANAEQNASADSTAAAVAEEAAPAKPVLKRGQNVPFEKTVSEGKISFTVSSPNVPERNTMVIFSKGLENRNDTFQIEVSGQVHAAQLADLNTDGFPEVYVFTQQKENELKGNVYVFTSYRNRSYGQAYLRELPAANNLMPAQGGMDHFALEDGQLVRKVGPAAEGEAATAQATSIVYELKSGEASYQLVPKQGQ